MDHKSKGMEKMTFQLERVEELYSGFLGLKRYHLRHDCFQGGQSDRIIRERIEGYRAAATLLYDPLRDEVVMIEQFRIGAIADPQGAWLLEIIGGLIEGDESPAEVARREAQEEAGCEVTDLIEVCGFWVSPGFSTEHVTLFCGCVDATNAGGIHGLAHEGEDIRVVVMSVDEVIAELYGGRVNSTTAIVAVQWLALHREEIRKAWGVDPGESSLTFKE